MLEMFYGIALKSLFGLFLVSLSVASYITTEGATSLYLFEIMRGYRVSKSFASTPLESSIKCARVCVREGNCSATSYDTTGKICEFHSEDMYSDWNENTSSIVAAHGWELLMSANISFSNTPGNVTETTTTISTSPPSTTGSPDTETRTTVPTLPSSTTISPCDLGGPCTGMIQCPDQENHVCEIIDGIGKCKVIANGVSVSCAGLDSNCPGNATCHDGTTCYCKEGWRVGTITPGLCSVLNAGCSFGPCGDTDNYVCTDLNCKVKADGIGESCLGNSANCPGAATCLDGIHCSCNVGWVATEIGECVEVPETTTPVPTSPPSTTRSPGGCSNSGYILLETYSLCIRISTDQTDWITARSNCQADGGDLLMMKDAGFKIHLQDNVFTNTRYWIGTYQFPGNNNDWYWVDGSTLSTDHHMWNTVEPNNVEEKCGEVEYSGGILVGNDVSCYNSYKGVCSMAPA